MSFFLNEPSSKYIKEYEIKERIGTGSFGFVYKAIKKNNNHQYVIKQIPFSPTNPGAELEEARNEAQILSQLNCKYVVKYYDSFEEHNNLFIVMEYCENGDLSSYLSKMKKKVKSLSENTIWKFFIQMSLGLAYIHSKKILHRDLKSLNIFLSKNLDVKIGDLGVAKILQNTMHAYTFIGTPFYLSPEILEEKPYNEKSDVWALGCILYELCTFKYPYNATNQAALFLKIKNGKYEPLSSSYSNELKKMVNIMLDKNYYTRPTMKQIIESKIFIDKARILGFKDLLIDIFGLKNSNMSNNPPPKKDTKGKMIKLIKVSPAFSSKKKETFINKKKIFRNSTSELKAAVPQNTKEKKEIIYKNRKSPSMIDFSFIKNEDLIKKRKTKVSLKNFINNSQCNKSNVSSDSNGVAIKAKSRSNSGNFNLKKFIRINSARYEKEKEKKKIEKRLTTVINEKTFEDEKKTVNRNNNVNNIRESDKGELYKFIEELNQKTLESKKNSTKNKKFTDIENDENFVVEEDNSKICVRRNVDSDNSKSDIEIEGTQNKCQSTSESENESEEEKVFVVKSQEINDEKNEMKKLKDKYLEKYNFYKKEIYKFSNQINCDKLFELFSQNGNNVEKIDEKTEQIEKYIQQSIPEKSKEFSKLFYNCIFYEIELNNITKAIEKK